MDEKHIEALLEDVRLMVRRLGSGPVGPAEDAAVHAIHRLYSAIITPLSESNAILRVDNSILQKHIVAENEAAKTIIDRLTTQLHQIIEEDEARAKRIRELLANADDE